jgi:hypothetical protein
MLALALLGIFVIAGAGLWPTAGRTGVCLAAPEEEGERRRHEEGQGPQFRVIGLENQPAPEAMGTLHELFKSDLFDDVRSKLAIAPNGPANAIVVVGPERAVDLIEGMLRELDQLTGEHRERTRHREAEHRERMQREHAERRERMEHERAERREMEERERGERRERGEDHDRRIEQLRDLLKSPQLRKKHPDLWRLLMVPRDGDRPELPQENLRRHMEQMRKMREQMEHFFREYDRPREDDRRGSSFFEGPGFRFESHPDTKRPKVKKL